MKSCTEPVYVEALGVYCDVQLLGMFSWADTEEGLKTGREAYSHQAKSPRRRSDKDLYLATLSTKHLYRFPSFTISLHCRRAMVTLRSIWALLLVVHAEDMAQLVCHVPGLGRALVCMGLAYTFFCSKDLENQRVLSPLRDLFG